MATKRIKFLNRKKLLQEHLRIRIDQQGPTRRFTPSLDLTSYGFPPEALVIVEAKTLLETLRFELGALGKGLNFAARDISKLQSERVTFNVFVLEPETARKLGTAETVRPLKSDQETAGPESLLPVDLVDDLGGQVWGVRYEDTDSEGQSDAPVLVFARDAAKGSAAVYVKEPEVRAMVMPAAFREVLGRILLADHHDFDEDGTGWRNAWLRLGASLAGDEPPQGEKLKNASEIYDWIDQAVKGLAQRHGLMEAYLQERRA